MLESKNSTTAIPQTLSIPNEVAIDVNQTTITAGSVISWNVDPNNDNGVLVYATFSPSNQINIFIAEQNQQSITRGIVLPDTQGSYTVTTEDLEIFPDNSVINITVSRGVTTTPGNGAPIVTAISSSSTSAAIDY